MFGFVVYDYIVFCLIICVFLVIGVYYVYVGQKIMFDFLVGGCQMKVFLVVVFLMVFFEFFIMMLGYLVEIYVYGMMFWLLNIGFFVLCFFVICMVVFFVYLLKIMSVNEVVLNNKRDLVCDLF